VLGAGRYSNTVEYLDTVGVRKRIVSDARVAQATVFAAVVQIEGKEGHLKASMSCCIEVHVVFRLP